MKRRASIRKKPSQASDPIPQLCLTAQFSNIRGEVRAAIERVLKTQQFVLGKEGAALEEDVARLCGSAHAVGVASGTDALILALRACGVRSGDEVLLPPFTFVATGSAVSALGARPVFADIHPDTFNLNPDELKRRVTPRTRAILVVHLYGLAADMDPILAFAAERKIPVIEDNAQAIGAGYKGRRTGSFGDAACLSFYPTKNLGAYGDAGMVVTNSPTLAERIRTLRNHGQTAKYVSSEPGWNSRLDELQAAEYRRLLAKIPGIWTPTIPAGCEHVFHQYTIRAERRDALQRYLSENRIGSAVYYPVPLHLQPLYASLGYKPGDFPCAERASREALSLPMFPELTAKQITRVANAIADFALA